MSLDTVTDAVPLAAFFEAQEAHGHRARRKLCGAALDHYTDLVAVNLAKSKTTASDMLQGQLPNWQGHSGAKVKGVRFNGGTKTLTNRMKKYLEEQGVVREMTTCQLEVSGAPH